MTDQADMEARAMWLLADKLGDLGLGMMPLSKKRHAAIISAMIAFEAERGTEREAAAKTARARELGIMDRVLTDAENAIYDAGRVAAYARAAEVARDDALILSESRREGSFGWTRKNHGELIATAIEALGEAK